MSITENTLAVATAGIDLADCQPEITPAMVKAGAAEILAPLCACSTNPDEEAPRYAKAVFEAMWKAHVQAALTVAAA